MSIEKFDIEADVVVVGYGGAGACAAITAHDNGASALACAISPTVGDLVLFPGGLRSTVQVTTKVLYPGDPALFEKFEQ